MAKWGEERRERCHSDRSEAKWRNLSGQPQITQGLFSADYTDYADSSTDEVRTPSPLEGEGWGEGCWTDCC